MTSQPKKTHRDCVEQAIAFGRSPDWMIEHLAATDLEIDAAMRWMDACDAEDDEDEYRLPCGTHAGYDQHRTHGEPVCGRCRVAEHEYRRTGLTRGGSWIGGRPAKSYRGPADPSTIADLIDALSPTYSRPKKAVAA